jgi:hypothetical protein
MGHFDEAFAILARVSRQPYGTLFVSASSTTEFVLKHGCSIVNALDNFVQGIQLQKLGGLTPDESEKYTRCWKSVREPFHNSGSLMTMGKCLEMAAEVEWEYQRALGLVPPEQKKPMAPDGAVEVFFSYSHKDEKLRDSVAKHLSQLKHEGLIRDWHDRRIPAGTEWDGEIDGHLKSAHVIVLLVSSDFLASRYCHDVEVKRAMERHEAGDARVIPVILRQCDWHSAPFGKLLALPKDGRAVTSWSNRDEAFTDVAKGIRAAAKEVGEAVKS